MFSRTKLSPCWFTPLQVRDTQLKRWNLSEIGSTYLSSRRRHRPPPPQPSAGTAPFDNSFSKTTITHIAKGSPCSGFTSSSPSSLRIFTRTRMNMNLQNLIQHVFVISSMNLINQNKFEKHSVVERG
ncbi:hypothetical protein JHK82_030902 [Glycine max]|nr:hypothetical protein JHK82_030902 [Glycine max]